ncbi:YhdT family protein [Endozoicomonas sp. Mp262]|uniref:YhdT family protein n=1 Tax=Endozoicomonas sp. Mp262 TaxID=2919499 RepID=UPI0021D95E94
MKTLYSRYSQAHREACWAIGLTLAYFLWWYLSAYGLAPDTNNLESFFLIFGMPLWFFVSCIVAPVLFTVLCGLMVRYIFIDMPLDVDPAHQGNADEL